MRPKSGGGIQEAEEEMQLQRVRSVNIEGELGMTGLGLRLSGVVMSSKGKKTPSLKREFVSFLCPEAVSTKPRLHSNTIFTCTPLA